jgi:predicted cobalt transporter CbtA
MAEGAGFEPKDGCPSTIFKIVESMIAKSIYSLLVMAKLFGAQTQNWGYGVLTGHFIFPLLKGNSHHFQMKGN